MTINSIIAIVQDQEILHTVMETQVHNNLEIIPWVVVVEDVQEVEVVQDLNRVDPEVEGVQIVVVQHVSKEILLKTKKHNE